MTCDRSWSSRIFALLALPCHVGFLILERALVVGPVSMSLTVPITRRAIFTISEFASISLRLHGIIQTSVHLFLAIFFVIVVLRPAHIHGRILGEGIPHRH